MNQMKTSILRTTTKHRRSRTNQTYTHPHLNKKQILACSIKIQQAFELERPLLIIYRSAQEIEQFAGYIGELNLEKRSIQLLNGSLKKQIAFSQIIDIHVY
jgi:hypothetical protein